MPVRGLGIDIVEIDRIRDLLEREPRAASRLFTQAELDHCVGKQSCYVHLAGRFAAKEAVGKAIGKALSWQEVEIISTATGRPEVRLHGSALEAAGGAGVQVSISHTAQYATAVAILED